MEEDYKKQGFLKRTYQPYNKTEFLKLFCSEMILLSSKHQEFALGAALCGTRERCSHPLLSLCIPIILERHLREQGSVTQACSANTWEPRVGNHKIKASLNGPQRESLSHMRMSGVGRRHITGRAKAEECRLEP